jgi:hypothetical protein
MTDEIDGIPIEALPTSLSVDGLSINLRKLESQNGYLNGGRESS